MERLTLSAIERIKNSQEITTLIHNGQAFFLAPYKVYYTWEDKSAPFIRVAFSVPKKKFGKAVMRNRLKRLSRESFRLQKNKLHATCLQKNKQLNILFLYQQTVLLPFDAVCKSVGEIIDKIIKHNG